MNSNNTPTPISTISSNPNFKTLLLSLVQILNYTFSPDNIVLIISDLPPEFSTIDMKLISHIADKFQDNCYCTPQPCNACHFIDSTIFDLKHPNAKEIHEN